MRSNFLRKKYFLISKPQTQAKGHDPFFAFFEHAVKTIYLGGQATLRGIPILVRNIRKFPNPALGFIFIWGVISFVTGRDLDHVHFLYWLSPDIFGGWILRWLLSFSIGAHMLFIFLSGILSIAFVLGAYDQRFRNQLKRRLEAIGLTDSFGQVPKLVGIYPIDQYRDKIVFRAESFGLERFESKRSQLSAILENNIFSITHGKNPAYIEVVLNTMDISSRLTMRDLESSFKFLKPESFYIGESMEGVIQQRISELPHLMIAGTTGGGKSVFFKQALYCLLKSSPHLQMYLIDLKGGLEFSDFKAAPNVRVVKTSEDAVVLLEAIEQEMYDRFKYLEKEGKREIDPARDKKDRIVVAIDEASVLYAKRSFNDDESELTKRAREVTDSISKLGRAAGIHLILATQKVSKETIETTIQENVSARMCFKMNTLHGSLTVLGTKDAMELPPYPGRAIWLNGGKQIQVQAPLITPDEIRSLCERLKREYDNGSKSVFGEMVGSEKPNPGLRSLFKVVQTSEEGSRMND